MPYMKDGSPFLFDDVTGDIVGIKDPDGSEHLFNSTLYEKPVFYACVKNALAIAGDTKALIRWTTSIGESPSSYTITASNGMQQTFTASPAIFTGLTNGTAITFSIVANYSAGSSPAVSTSAVTPSAAPTGLSDILGLAFWFKADALSGYSNGASVSTLPDSSGNGNTGTLLGTAPTYLASWTNGLPALTFSAGGFLLPAAFNTKILGPALSVFALCDCTSLTNASSQARQMLFTNYSYVAVPTFDQTCAFGIDTNGGAWRTFNGSPLYTSSGTLTLSTPTVVSARACKGGRAYVNGVANSAGTYPLEVGASRFAVGDVVNNSYLQFTGRIAEFLVFAKGVTVAEANLIHSYLGTRGAVSITTATL